MSWLAWEPFGIYIGGGAEASSPIPKSKGASGRKGWELERRVSRGGRKGPPKEIGKDWGQVGADESSEETVTWRVSV